MAKELPYFKFEPAEYLTKDISFCSLSAQGLFINICSYYWQRNCKLTKEQLLKRLNYETELNELINEGVIDLKDSYIIIKFLDIQLIDVAKTSKQNSENGSKGGRPKKPKINPVESENKPTALIPLSETKGIREDKIKEDKNISVFIEESHTPVLNNNFTEIQFLQRWKDARMYYDKQPTHISKLNTFELIDFNELKKTYNLKDFERAMQGMFQQKTLPTVRLRPTHFLKMNYFEQYLTCFTTKEKLFDNNKYKKPIERI
jgi:hypothetical protein